MHHHPQGCHLFFQICEVGGGLAIFFKKEYSFINSPWIDKIATQKKLKNLEDCQIYSKIWQLKTPKDNCFFPHLI
jgi:hypothetical protein